ncbi:hypothetical protein IQ265_13855 [Nodosilinea sp. LEGE 06152]|uniref:hypothetical protein n=1 Tax=Nodosilinea sp. LEGE 06152 TaxID=2777966 RepID=UPI00187FCE33|nr:hypothetical protein [Nodosilinea sp. LEGE 06152]MBE9157901.1 hypothetical protein [Nodosilinea sp. LEGE 06152]
MMISTLKVGLVGAIALASLAPAALASSVSINTDRVQLQVSNNGQVYIRTLADQPLDLVRPAIAPQADSTLPLPRANFAPGCTARSHSSDATRSTPGGNVVYSENRSTTRVCQ